MSRKTVFILLFRGVGGATQLPTAPLRAALMQAGFENAATYINSGNALVRTKLSREKTVAKVAAICREKFGFNKAIHAPTLEEWSALIAGNPFPHALARAEILHAAVLAEHPTDENIEKIRSLAVDGEAFTVIGKVAYIHTPNGLDVKLAEKFDKQVGVENTARNWNTVLKLEALAKKAAAD